MPVAGAEKDSLGVAAGRPDRGQQEALLSAVVL